jgi:HlyD family secretion protein
MDLVLKRLHSGASLLLALVACGAPEGGAPPPEVEAPPARSAPLPATVVAAAGEGVEQAVEVEARVLSESEVTVVARADGIVSEVLAARGDRVRAGQVLVRLERRELELELRAAQAELARASGVEEKRRALLDQGLVSTLAYEESLHDLEVAEAACELSEHLLERTDVRAPVAGVIVERAVRPGQFVRAADGISLFRVAGNGPREVRVYLPEWASDYVRFADRVAVTPRYRDAPAIEARIGWVSPVLDPLAGTVEVRIVLPVGPATSAGSLLQVRFGLRSDPARLTLPRAAFLESDPAPGAEATIAVEAGGVVSPRRVRVGVVDSARVEIRAGLAAGERVRLRAADAER